MAFSCNRYPSALISRSPQTLRGRSDPNRARQVWSSSSRPRFPRFSICAERPSLSANEHFIRARSFSGWTHTLLVSRATASPRKRHRGAVRHLVIANVWVPFLSLATPSSPHDRSKGIFRRAPQPSRLGPNRKRQSSPLIVIAILCATNRASSGQLSASSKLSWHREFESAPPQRSVSCEPNLFSVSPPAA